MPRFAGSRASITKWQENTPKGKAYTAVTTAQGVEEALKILEDRWKLIILFHLFGGKVLRFAQGLLTPTKL